MQHKKEIETLYQYYNNTLSYVEDDEFCRIFAKEKLVHSLQVIGAGNHIIKHEPAFKNCSASLLKCAKTAYALHDIGRFNEIEKIYDIRAKKNEHQNLDHGILGYQIISTLPEYNDVRVSLSIKHHGNLIERFYEDEEYLNIKNNTTKEEVEKIIFLVRDADKIANFYLLITQYSEHKSAWELSDDKNYLYGKINDACVEYIRNKKCIPLDIRKSYPDKLLNVLSWIFDINYQTSFLFIKKHNIVDKISNILKQYNNQNDLIDSITQDLREYIDEKVSM